MSFKKWIGDDETADVTVVVFLLAGNGRTENFRFGNGNSVDDVLLMFPAMARFQRDGEKKQTKKERESD